MASVTIHSMRSCSIARGESKKLALSFLVVRVKQGSCSGEQQLCLTWRTKKNMYLPSLVSFILICSLFLVHYFQYASIPNTGIGSGMQALKRYVLADLLWILMKELYGIESGLCP